MAQVFKHGYPVETAKLIMDFYVNEAKFDMNKMVIVNDQPRSFINDFFKYVVNMLVYQRKIKRVTLEVTDGKTG